MSSEEDANGGAAPGWQAETRLSDPKAMRALAHPVRMALLELLAVAGTVTATQASEVLGESPANCAFHLRTLGKYGFVIEAGGGRGRERPWMAAQRSLTISASDQKDPQAAVAADALSQVWFERWIDRARRALAGSDPDPAWEEAKQWSRSARFLTAEEAGQVTREVRQILDRYQDRDRDPSRRPPGAMPVECAYFTFPITEFAGVAGEGGGEGGEKGAGESAGGSEQSQDIS
jgi:DNA-binding transcriptional ArsR family regulator